MRASQWSFSAPSGAGAQQVEEDLGAGLAGADDGDVLGFEDAFAVGEVVGGVDDGDGGGVGEEFERFGDVGFGADAEGDVAGVGAAEGLDLAVVVELGEVDLEQGAFGVPADGVDLVAEVESGELSADPAAVRVVLGALDVEALGEVERVQPLARPEVAEEGPGARRVDEGHQVGQEGHLEGGVVEEQAGVPVEGGALFEEGGGDSSVDAVGERGEGEVERSDADADQIVRPVVIVC